MRVRKNGSPMPLGWGGCHIAGSTDGRLADSMQIDIEEVVRLRNMFGLVKNLSEHEVQNG